MNKNMNGQSMEQETRMTLQLMKRCLVLFKIEVQIETTAQCHFSCIRLAMTQSFNNTVLAWVWETSPLAHYWWECKLVQLLSKILKCTCLLP